MRPKVQRTKNIFHLFKAIITNVYYRFPSRKLRVIGVTGTDGKTTTTSLIYHILKEAGKKVSMISSVYANIAGRISDVGLHVTTPDAFDVQKYLSLSAKNDDQFFVLETTSHALDQNRVWGVNFFASVLTNVTHEHLDYHQTYENYVKTKVKLLLASKIAVVNRDDESYELVNRIIQNAQLSCRTGFGIFKILKQVQDDTLEPKVVTYGIKKRADFNWNNEIKTNLLGKFNQYNILAAYALCKAIGIDEKLILRAIGNFKLPKGRLDVVHEKDFKVIIDFAHTPNAIAQVLQVVKNEILKDKKGRIIHIFGSAGLRDVEKRPKMGEESAKYADVVILTEEDYRTEDVGKICDQIASGLIKMGFQRVTKEEIVNNKKRKVFTVVTDRAVAIILGISLAKKDDVVITTGKSHEKSLCRGKIECPWDEYKAVKKALELKMEDRSWRLEKT